ncbi:MAG: hypothetical protein IJX86_02130 [Lachnospiraceae bacterium]|nr:hypothetical protein [Lachnospiraceae bacterium]
MDYREVIRSKNKILSVAFLASIVLRGIVNAIFVGIQTVIGLVVAGLIVSAVLFFVARKMNPIIMMYLMVVVLTGISIACMVMFPTTTNYLMFFLAIFMIVLYEDIRPIVLQCICSAVCMIIFYFKYTQELAATWSVDAMAMCIVYIVSGLFVFWALCRLTGQQFTSLKEINAQSNAARERAEQLLEEIRKSVEILEITNNKINESIMVTEEISAQISLTAGDVAQGSIEDVTATETIKGLVQDGVDKIRNVSKSSVFMTEISNATNGSVSEGGNRVRELNERMRSLNEKMDTIEGAITELNEENKKISQILTTLDEITTQTNLLSLNASIEAARAGEHGKGFAVVAMEIRNLSDTSAKFTEQINTILMGIQNRTAHVVTEIVTGRECVEDCSKQMENVDMSFRSISDNTTQVLSQAQTIEEQAKRLESLLNKTLDDVNHINGNVAVTSKAMEEISAGITRLHSNVDIVVNGYNDINAITTSLVQVAQ